MKKKIVCNNVEDPLDVRIKQYLDIKGIGEVILTCADTVIRRYLSSQQYGGDFQSKIVSQNEEYLNSLMKKNGHVNSLVYKVIELGELIKCKEMWGCCEHAKECWVTRRGFCQKQKEKKQEQLTKQYFKGSIIKIRK